MEYPSILKLNAPCNKQDDKEELEMHHNGIYLMHLHYELEESDTTNGLLLHKRHPNIYRHSFFFQSMIDYCLNNIKYEDFMQLPICWLKI